MNTLQSVMNLLSPTLSIGNSETLLSPAAPIVDSLHADAAAAMTLFPYFRQMCRAHTQETQWSEHGQRPSGNM